MRGLFGRWGLVGLALVLACAEEAVDGHGQARDLGTREAGPFQVTTVMYGELVPGREIAVDVRLSGPRGVSALSARLADEAGTGTLDEAVPRMGTSGTFHGHLPVPEGLPEDADLWVRVRDDRGEQHEARFPLR